MLTAPGRAATPLDGLAVHDRHPRGRLPRPDRPGVPRMSTASRRLPGARDRHRQGLPARPDVAVLRGGLPADVPGAVRRPLRRPGPARRSTWSRSATSPLIDELPAGREAAFDQTFEVTHSRPTSTRPSRRCARATPTSRSRCGATRLVAHYTADRPVEGGDHAGRAAAPSSTARNLARDRAAADATGSTPSRSRTSR